MTRFKIGISDFPFDRDRYHREWSIVELRIGLTSPPGPRTLRKWAQQAPDGFEHIWVASQHFTAEAGTVRAGRPLKLQEGEHPNRCGLFQDTSENRRLWDDVVKHALAINASTILLETPAAFVPSPTNKDRLRAFQSAWGTLPEGLRIAWDPAGFWQREETIELADELNWILAVDPLVDPDEPIPAGPTGFFRLAGRFGLRSHYTDDDFLFLIDLAAPFEEVVMIFRTGQPLKDARRMRDLVASFAPPEH